MTPNLTIRSFSNDQYTLDKAFYSNHYKLKGFKGEGGPIVVDIGAHCGYFTFAALSLGASKVYSFEPFLENYKILIKNTESVDLGKVISYQLGVYTENTTVKINYPKIIEGTYYDFANLKIEDLNIPHFNSPCVTLDYILKHLVSEEVDILKFNIGYAEFDILFGSQLLEKRVRSIVLEVSETPERIKEFVDIMKGKGYPESAVAKIPDEEGKFIVVISKDKLDTHFNISI